jgi:hypothetical protein
MIFRKIFQRITRRDRFAPARPGLTTVRIRRVEPKALSEKTIDTLKRAEIDPAFVNVAEQQLRRAH